jgi:Nitrous oxide-stimulated promoter
LPKPVEEPSPPERSSSRRVRREKRTITVMIGMYCRAHHLDPGSHREESDSEGSSSHSNAGSDLCEECVSLHEYALLRIDKCRFGDDKPTCAQCTVHCFRSEMREQIRTVMRYSGPRMTLSHPYLAMRHLLDARASSDET